VVETSSGAKSLVLAEILDLDVRELFGGIFDEVAEDTLVVVTYENNLLDVWDFGDGLQTVPNDRVAGNIEQRLLGGLWLKPDRLIVV
jgi:hypothetical protein